MKARAALEAANAQLAAAAAGVERWTRAESWSEALPPLRGVSTSGKIAHDSLSPASPTMLHKILTACTLLLSVGVVSPIHTPIAAQESIDRAMMDRLSAEAQARSRVLESYRTLTDVIGPRLTGSPGFQRAVDVQYTGIEYRCRHGLFQSGAM